MSDALPPPARYFPFGRGTYDVLPGLRPFDFDFGNGAADSHVFQIDSQFHQYRSTKLEARRDPSIRPLLTERFSSQAAAEVAHFIVDRLVTEHPRWFELRDERGVRWLTCHLSNETLCFDGDWRLADDGIRSEVTPRYSCSLDALACQVQEELAITCSGESGNWLAALHVCLPSHWRPEEKLGKDFAKVHSPVPGMEPFTRNQEKLVGKMLGATSGLVRFVWGIQWTAALNRHPTQCDVSERFNSQIGNAFVRVERQTIWGLPESRSSLFTIRPYLMHASDIKQHAELARALASAIDSMSTESLQYKGVLYDKDAFLGWLRRTP